MVKIDWKEWDRVVGHRLDGVLAGDTYNPLLTENQWAKQYIEGLLGKSLREQRETHNLIAIATTKASDGKYYDKEVVKRIENIVSDLAWQRDKNDEIIKNLNKLIKRKE